MSASKANGSKSEPIEYPIMEFWHRDFRTCDIFYGKVTFVRHPRSFFVVPIPEFNNMSALNIAGSEISRDQAIPGLGVVYVSPRKRFKVRGTILEVEGGDYYKILAIDHGFTEIVPLKNIYHAAGISRWYPPLAIRCSLVSCSPSGDQFSIHAIFAFILIMGGGPYDLVKVTIRGWVQDRFLVSLCNSRGEDVASVMAHTNADCHFMF